MGELADKIAGPAAKWSTYGAFGSFVLYLLGYLTLRFQLSTYGVAVNLDAFNEKYLFAGCRFLVYLVSTIPNIVIVAVLAAAIVCLPYAALPSSVKARLRGGFAALQARTRLPAWIGIVFAVATIQFAMRRCFALGNVLLRNELPGGWLKSLLLGSGANLSLYFTALVAATLLGAALFLGARREVAANGAGSGATRPQGTLLTGLLGFLVATQFLLLPINYGVLIATQTLPEVVPPALAAQAFPSPTRAWLVWDGGDAYTYLVRAATGERQLLTMPKKDLPLAIVAYDDILCVLYGRDHRAARPC